VEPHALLQSAESDARALLNAAETGWARPVPDCPGWDAAELVHHTDRVFRWMAAIVTSGARVRRGDGEVGPEDPDELAAWYLTGLDRVLEALGSADPDAETWTFSSTGDRRVRWWCRRLAVELAIHRHDAERAAAGDGGPQPAALNGDVAAAGIEEFMLDFLPGLLAREGNEGLNGTLHLHAIDGPSEWWVDLGAGGVATAEHAKADTAVRGTRSDLLLRLTNRGPLPDLEIFGNREILDHWGQLSR
jgi:uncharacterized protein (TIGR03083 family)